MEERAAEEWRGMFRGAVRGGMFRGEYDGQGG